MAQLINNQSGGVLRNNQSSAVLINGPNSEAVPVFADMVPSGGAKKNHSGIGHDLKKLALMPQGWNELDGYRESWKENDMKATRVFNGPWGNRKDFIDYLLGYSTAELDVLSGNYFLSRIVPAQHPEFPWLYAIEVEELQGVGAYTNNPNAFVQDALGNPVVQQVFDPERGKIPAVIPLGIIHYYDSSSLRDTSSCTLRVTYRHRAYEVRNDEDAYKQPTRELSRCVTREYHPAIEHLGLSRLTGRMFYSEGPAGTKGSNIPEGGVMRIPTMQLTMTWHQVPDLPWGAFQNCTGKINLNKFDGAPGYREFPAGTLLCHAPRVDRWRSITGRIRWEIVYRFDYRGSVTAFDGTPATWNHYPDSFGFFCAAGFYPNGFVDGGANVPVYQSANFDELFKAVAPVSYQ